MEHTIVIEVPDNADDRCVEQRITEAIERLSVAIPTAQLGYRLAKVVEYHRERMLEEPDYGEIYEDQDPEAIATQVEDADMAADRVPSIQPGESQSAFEMRCERFIARYGR
jgi:broad specificity phosphatase PhoE